MKKRAQVWIETVLYTLIGLALIGLVLAFITPKITQARDKLIVEQTISSLNVLDEKINIVLDGGPDNIRIVDFTIKRGALYFNSSSDEIVFIIDDLKYPYSQPNVTINYGRISVYSEQGQKNSLVSLKMSYSSNLTYSGTDQLKKFSAASVPYKFSIHNLGNINNDGINVVDIDDISGG